MSLEIWDLFPYECVSGKISTVTIVVEVKIVMFGLILKNPSCNCKEAPLPGAQKVQKSRY